MKQRLLLLILLMVASSAFANENTKFDFKNVDVVRVYDGDTIFVNISQVPSLFGEELGVRLKSIDTPEIRGKCEEEKLRANAAKNLVVTLLQNNDNKVVLKNCERGKYFRIICDVYAPIDIGQVLLENSLANSYYGGTKIDWCENTLLDK